MRRVAVTTTVLVLVLAGETRATTLFSKTYASLLPKTYASLQQNHGTAVKRATKQFNRGLGDATWKQRIRHTFETLPVSLPKPVKVRLKGGVLGKGKITLVISDSPLSSSSKTLRWFIKRGSKKPKVAVIAEVTWPHDKLRSRIDALLSQGAILSLQESFATSVVHLLGGGKLATKELDAALLHAVRAAQQVLHGVPPNGRISGLQFHDGAPRLEVEISEDTAVPIRVSEAGRISIDLDRNNLELLSIMTHEAETMDPR